MGIQATQFVVLLLLSASFLGAECEVAKYTRKVKGRILGKNVLKPSELVPVPNGNGDAECTATVTYVTSSKKSITRSLTAATFFTAKAKGLYSGSITFVDNDFKKADKVSSFQVSCVISAALGTVSKTVTSSGNKDINGGDIVAYWAVPLQVKGSLACAGSGKAISSTTFNGACTIDFVPRVNQYTITIGGRTSKDGSFSLSAVPYFEGNPVPLTGRFTKTTLTCQVDFPPKGTTVIKANKPVVINSANYDLGKVLLRDDTKNKKYCK